jgi:hypothetical protein
MEIEDDPDALARSNVEWSFFISTKQQFVEEL